MSLFDSEPRARRLPSAGVRRALRHRFLVLGLLTLSGGCGWNGPKPDGSGTIECTQVQVAPQVGGRIARLAAPEGALVKRGELLAELDGADYRLKRDEARAARAVAQAQLDLLRAGTRPEDVQRAREQVRGAQAAARAAAADQKRTEQVFGAQGATQKQLDEARAQAEGAAAALAAAEQTLERLLRGARKEELRVAEAQVEQASVRLAQAEKLLADCQVLAPLDGVVTTRSHEEGEVVGAGTPLMTVSRLDEVWLSVYVPENRLPKVKLGRPAYVRLDGQPQPFRGVITFVAPEAEFTPRNVQTPEERAKLVYRVKVTLANPQGVLKPGMPADGFLEAPPGK